jgi:hypothetical protein
MALFKVLD